MRAMLGSRRSGGRLFCVNKLFFKCLDPSEQFRKALLEDGDFPFEQIRYGGVSVDEAARCHVDADAGLSARLHAFADRDVTTHSDLAAEHHIVLELRTARNADLPANQTVATDDHIVSDLDEVIDLRPLAYDGLAEARAIDGRVRTDFNEIGRASCRER